VNDGRDEANSVPSEAGLVGTDVLGWKALRPGARKSSQPRQLNAATIARLAGTLRAREWSRAKGRGRSGFDRQLAEFERQAAEYHQDNERRRLLEAQARELAARLIHSLQESLSAFASALCELAPEERPARADGLLRESLRPVGHIDHVHWNPGGCEIVFEPWEERRLRRKTRGIAPVLFRASVDGQLRLTDCVPLEAEAYEASRRESIVDRIGEALRRRGRTPDVLGEALWEVGRVICRFTMNDGAIKVTVEPWEEVRRRRMERGGQPPVKSYMVTGNAALGSIRCELC